MNREIKFRGQSIGTKEWIYGYYFKTPLTENATPFDLGWYLPADIVERHCIAGSDGRVYVVIPETVGQYTGLRDQQGHELYEGDFVKCFDNYGGTTFEGPVEFRHGSFMIACTYLSAYRLMDYTMEKLGDIFSNPVKEGI